MKTRSSVRTIGALLAGSGAQLTASVGSALLATLLLPVEQRGLMVVVATIASFVGILGGAGVGNAYRHRQPSAPDPARMAAEFTWLGVGLVAASAVAGAVACAVMGTIADPRLAGWTFLVATAAAGSVQVLMLLVTEARFALGEYAAGARWAAAAAAAGLGGVCLALAAGGDAAAVIASQAACQGAVLLAAGLAATRARALAWGPPAVSGMKVFLGAGLRSLVLPVAIVVVSRFDRLALAVFGTTEAVALFALAATLVEIARLAPTAIGQITTRETATGSEWPLMRRRLLQGVAAAAAAGVVLVALAFLTVSVIFGPAYSEAPALAAVLLGSEVVSAIVIVANLAIIGGGWSTSAIRIGVVAIVVAIPLYAVGAILGGPFGVAIARFVVFALLATMMWVVLRNRVTPTER